MISSLQYLRGLAALMIVYYHALKAVHQFSGTALPVSVSASGVDIFFVISGVVMWITTADGRATPSSFFRKRMIRIVPLYWTITLFVAAVALVAPHLLNSTRFDLPHFLASLVFIPWENPKYPGLWPVVIPGWTLNYEMMFYSVFALALFLPLRFRLVATLAVLGTLAFIGSVAPAGGIRGFYTNPIILEFGAGLLIGALYTSTVTVSSVISAALVLGGVGLLFGFIPLWSAQRLVVSGLPAALIVTGLVMIEKRTLFVELPLFRHLGDASYSTYLTHIITVPAVTAFLTSLSLDLTGLWAPLLLFYLAASAVVGSATWYVVEQPMCSAARLLWPETRGQDRSAWIGRRDSEASTLPPPPQRAIGAPGPPRP
jgi:exopolysaccharide production protein ExoZ